MYGHILVADKNRDYSSITRQLSANAMVQKRYDIMNTISKFISSEAVR